MSDEHSTNVLQSCGSSSGGRNKWSFLHMWTLYVGIGPTYIHTMHLLTDGADTFITSRTKYIVRICLLLYPLPTMVHFHKKMTK